ncbi:MFS transporter [candidate division KSB1 bacterium]|nr:MFS transporter [candidate division KSB1 bacterium]MBL7092707.1 MFS transporter [candidate division KSB1 bacterium]
MLRRILNFYRVTPAKPVLIDETSIKATYKKLRLSVFLSATLGYSLYYVCRLSMSVVKKPIVDAGILNESELGIIGSALFFVYAIGKFTNGFLADRSNIRRFMSTGLLLSALVNLILGFTSLFLVFAILWGMNGWLQAMGAAPGVVSLSRWFSNKERGTYYGIWSASHGLGKAITFIVVAFIVSFLGWRWGFYGAGIQDVVSGFLINNHKIIVNGVETYDFSVVKIFWVSAAIMSVVLALLVWNAKASD